MSTTAYQPDGREGTADFRISDVLKGRIAAPGIHLPCRTGNEKTAIAAGKEPLPYFLKGERALLFLKQKGDDVFSVVGGEYGRVPLSKNHRGEWLASIYLPLGSLQSTLPDTRSAIPLAALESIIGEILETGDFRDDPAYIDASISQDKIEDLRKARRRENLDRRGRDFWQN